MRQSFQHGSVIRVPLKSGDYWRFRWRESGIQRSEYLGTVVQYPTKALAEKAAERFRQHINAGMDVITIADLIEKFWRECPPERETTAHSYRSIFKRIEGQWGSLRMDEFARDILAVETWLRDLLVIGRHPKPGKAKLVSPLYRGQVRNLLHLLIEKAMLWGHLQAQRNPMDLVRLKNTSQRAKDLTILTLDQYRALLEDTELPLLVKTMVQISAGLGLRVSEVLGLKWADLDFEAGTVFIHRSVVNGVSNGTKTASSREKLPLHEELIGVLRNWRMAAPVVQGWVFGSARTGLPYERDYLRGAYLQPAGERMGVPGLGWHAFRHLYRAMLRSSGTPLETQKNLLRHSKLSTTIDVYGGQSKVEELRPANAAVIDILTRRSA